MRIGRAIRGLATAIVLSASTHGAAAEQSGTDLKEACAASYEQAQTLRRATKLSLARAQLAVCRKTCPESLAADCRSWAEQIDREMPSVLIVAVDRGGNPVTGIELEVDGELRELPASGSALPLDPGSHRLRLRFGDETHTADLELKARERRELRMTFTSVEPAEPADSPAPPPADRNSSLRVPPAVWPLAAIGVLGLGTGAVLGLKGQVDRSELRSRCAPNCDQDEVDAIDREWKIAAVAAAVGAVAGGVAVWLVLDENHETRVGVQANGPGALGVIGGRF